VWGGEDIDLVPHTVFVVTRHTGGQVFAAYDGGRMIGFTLAFPAFQNGRPYLHSHMTAVLDEYQNRGIGRRLKLFQREDAMKRGIEQVEWTFDPLEIRNAYFNLVRLGAVVQRYNADFYGPTTSPLHANLPTDRLVAEWMLRSARVEAAVAERAPAAPEDAVRILVPADIATLRRTEPAKAAQIQRGVRDEFQKWFAKGYAAVGMEVSAKGGTYLLAPAAKVEGMGK
jgi:predicted GNAT superfamily acetyltransferase